MNKEEFKEELLKIGISINEEQIKMLDEYYEMLVEYNTHTNLTRITEKKDVYLKHFYDSLTLSKVIKLNNQSLLDIGSGAGFPGMVLKIVFPNLRVTLVDSLNKRVMFLKLVIEKLCLNNIVAIHARAEEFILNNRELFDVVTSRAVAKLNILSELCIPFVKVNGCFISMKSEIEEEIINAESAIKTLGSVVENIACFELPNDFSKRKLVVIRKLSKTNVKYPRKFTEIKKKPL